MTEILYIFQKQPAQSISRGCSIIIWCYCTLGQTTKLHLTLLSIRFQLVNDCEGKNFPFHYCDHDLRLGFKNVQTPQSYHISHKNRVMQSSVASFRSFPRRNKLCKPRRTKENPKNQHLSSSKIEKVFF